MASSSKQLKDIAQLLQATTQRIQGISPGKATPAQKQQVVQSYQALTSVLKALQQELVPSNGQRPVLRSTSPDSFVAAR